MTATARTTTSAHGPHHLDAEDLQASFGARVVTLLGEPGAQPAPDIAERLRFAREQALARAQAARRQQRLAAASEVTVVGRGTAAVLARRTGWWVKLASAMPLAMLVCGLIVIDELHDHAQLAAAAEVDTALLTDALPPTAYTDPGFAEYLKSGKE